MWVRADLLAMSNTGSAQDGAAKQNEWAAGSLPSKPQKLFTKAKKPAQALNSFLKKSFLSVKKLFTFQAPKWAVSWPYQGSKRFKTQKVCFECPHH